MAHKFPRGGGGFVSLFFLDNEGSRVKPWSNFDAIACIIFCSIPDDYVLKGRLTLIS